MCPGLQEGREQPPGIRVMISALVGERSPPPGKRPQGTAALFLFTGTYRNSALSTAQGCNTLETSLAMCLVPKDFPAQRSVLLLSAGLGLIRLWPSGFSKCGKGSSRGQD